MTVDHATVNPPSIAPRFVAKGSPAAANSGREAAQWLGDVRQSVPPLIKAVLPGGGLTGVVSP